MAASLATTLFAGRVEASSAGLEAWGQAASQKAIALMRRRHRVDLASHRSTDVEDVHLEDCDFIVAMEPRFAKRLAEEFHVPIDRLITWNVEDPAIDDTQRAYELCLSEIEKLLPRILEVVQKNQHT